MNVSLRAQRMQEPMIPVVGDLIRRTPGCISLGQGVVWWGPPPEALAMISEFLADPANHKYHRVQGLPALLELIHAKLQAENGISLDGRSVLVTAGGNMAFSHALKAIADPGDEIVLQKPYYFNHEMAVTMAGCRPVLAATDASYQLRLDLIEAAITPKTRAVVTISPNNPTGAMYPESDLRALFDLCRRRGIYHIHDEAYEYFTYDEARHFSPASISGSEGNSIALYSLSKAYGFASWRIGYMVVPDRLVTAIKKIQDTTLICPPVISQFAAIGALRAGRSYCEAKLAETREVRQIAWSALSEASGLRECPSPQGAFYMLLKLSTNTPDITLVERLIQEYGIGLMPGSTFGVDSGCSLRLSYGPLRSDSAGEAMDRLRRGLEGLLKQ